jgi:hypothetical protein
MDTRAIVFLMISLLVYSANGAVEKKSAEDKRSEQDKAILAKLDSVIPNPEDLSPIHITRIREAVPDPVLDFKREPLADVIDFMSILTETDIFVPWNKLKNAGITKSTLVTLKLTKPTFKESLAEILETAISARTVAAIPKPKLRYAVEDGMIVVSLVPDPKKPLAAIDAPVIPKDLDKVTEINFTGQDLRLLVDYLKDVSGLKIDMNWDALAKAGITKTSPVFLRVKSARVSTILRLILEMLSDGQTPLRGEFKDETITVTVPPTPDNAKK